MQISRVLCGAKKLAAITSKRGNKNFYKGRGAPAPGFRTSRGGYVVDQARVATITFVAPDLTNFPLKAYVSLDTDAQLRDLKSKAAQTTTPTTA